MPQKPFIPTQRLFRLEAPPELRRQCLRAEIFRAVRAASSDDEEDGQKR